MNRPPDGSVVKVPAPVTIMKPLWRWRGEPEDKMRHARVVAVSQRSKKMQTYLHHAHMKLVPDPLPSVRVTVDPGVVVPDVVRENGLPPSAPPWPGLHTENDESLVGYSHVRGGDSRKQPHLLQEFPPLLDWCDGDMRRAHAARNRGRRMSASAAASFCRESQARFCIPQR